MGTAGDLLKVAGVLPTCSHWALQLWSQVSPVSQVKCLVFSTLWMLKWPRVSCCITTIRSWRGNWMDLKSQMNQSETVSQIKVCICQAQRFAKDRFGPWKILKLTSGFDQVDAWKKKKYSSTIPPVTFFNKLMMASSNYCILWTDDSPHSATPTAVGTRGPGQQDTSVITICELL